MSCANAIAYFNSDKVKGTIKFHQCICNNYTRVIFNLYNLTPNKISGIHIHEYGDESEGCKSLGGHWNPYKTTHGDFTKKMISHAGDLINNITPDKNGIFKFSYDDPRIKLIADINNSIIGRSVVIHEKEDDLGLGGLEHVNKSIYKIVNTDLYKSSLENGNSGDRIACAIIGHSKYIKLDLL